MLLSSDKNYSKSQTRLFPSSESNQVIESKKSFFSLSICSTNRMETTSTIPLAVVSNPARVVVSW